MITVQFVLWAARRMFSVHGRSMATVVVAGLGVWVAMTSGAMAQTINWVGTASTDWNTAANWDADVVPGSGNDVILDTNTGNQAVFSNGNATIGNLVVGNINGGANTALSITNGANLTAASLTIGASSGSNGTVSISGANSTLTVGSLSVGNFPPPSGGRGAGPASPTSSNLSTGKLFIGNGAIMTESGNFFNGPNGTITQTGGLVNISAETTNRRIVSPTGTTSPTIIQTFEGVYNLLGGVLESTSGLIGSGTLNLGGGTVEINNSADYGANTTLLDNTTSVMNLNLPISPIFGPTDCIWAGTINGNGSLQVTGNGLLIFDGSDTYTGNTSINGGTLDVNGNITVSSVTVNSGGVLTGQGNIAGSVTVNSGGSISPVTGDVGIGGASIGGTTGGGGGFGGAGAGTPSGGTSGGGAGGTRRVIVGPTGAIVTDGGGGIAVDAAGGGGGGAAGAGAGSGGASGGSSGEFSSVGGSNQLVPFTVGSLTLASGASTYFFLEAPNFYSNLSVTGGLSISGNLILSLTDSLYAGTYNLITAGNQTGDFDNVSVNGLVTGALVENDGVWSGTFSGVNFTFTTATGAATVSVNLPAGISAAKTTWLETHFTTTQLLDPAVSGDLATPAGDGVSNLMKYAFNLGPGDNAYTVLPQPVVGNGNLVLTFTEYQSDIVYTVEASTDMVNWSTDGVTVQMNGNVATATYPLPETGSAFMRVVVATGP